MLTKLCSFSISNTKNMQLSMSCRFVRCITPWTTAACYTSTSTGNKKLFKKIDAPVDTTSTEFVKNGSASRDLHEKYKLFMGLVNEGGGEKARDRHTKKNEKLLVMDRLKLLFDNADDMLEVGAFAGLGMKYGNVPRAGIVTAIGRIQGTYCIAIANDATVKGGTVFPIGVRKQLRSQQIAIHNHLPCIYVVDSGGAFLPLQAEIFTPGGRAFYNEAVLNSMNIPQLAIVCGSCTAGAAYIPTMVQESIIIDRMGTIFLGGPPLVYAALGEIVTPEVLGGGRLHSSVSGCTDYFAETEDEAFATSRDVVATFNMTPPDCSPVVEEPLYDCEEILGIIPASDQHTMDMYKVLARIVDGSRFHEFKKLFGPTVIAGFAFIQGHLVGIIANNGPMMEAAALKAAHFVQLCDQRDVPIIFLQNTSAHEDANDQHLIRSRAKLMSSVACSTVPKITIIAGNSLGADNYMMCGRSFDPRFLFCWPNAKTCIVDPELLLEEGMRAKFMDLNTLESAEYKEYKEKMSEKIALESSSFHSSGQLWDDGVILPQDTRKVLGKCLEIVQQKKYLPQSNMQYNVMRM